MTGWHTQCPGAMQSVSLRVVGVSVLRSANMGRGCAPPGSRGIFLYSAATFSAQIADSEFCYLFGELSRVHRISPRLGSRLAVVCPMRSTPNV